MAIEHGPFIVDLPMKNGDFSIMMLVYQRVIPQKKTETLKKLP